MPYRSRILSLLTAPKAIQAADFLESESPAMVLSHLPRLETGRLVLRALSMRDAQDVFAYSKDPQVAMYVLWDAHESISQTRAYLRSIIRQYRSGEPSTYGIVYKKTGKLIGTVGFMWMNKECRSAEIGYSLSRLYWNQGLMTEAVKAVLELGFRQLKLNRIEAQHDTLNPASGKVMQNCGMVKEGTLRQRIYNKGRFIDVDMYAIVAADYDRFTGTRI